MVYGKYNIQDKEIMFVWSRVNRRLFKSYFLYLNSKKEPTIEHGFDETASNNTKRCLEVMFWNHESFENTLYGPENTVSRELKTRAQQERSKEEIKSVGLDGNFGV